MRWAIDLMKLVFNSSLWFQGGSYSNKKGEGKAIWVYWSLSRENFERERERARETPERNHYKSFPEPRRGERAQISRQEYK